MSLFGIPVGLLGLAGAWSVGTRIWNLPPIVEQGIRIVGTSVWLVLVVLYLSKWFVHREEAARETSDPVQSSFVALVLISTMLVTVGVLQVSRPAGIGLFSAALAVEFALGVWLMGRVWQGGRGADFITPALYLPAVGQSFVAASVSVLVGWPQIGAWLFGCGALAWLATESVVMARAATRDPMPVGMRPAMGVQLAPPVVGGIAYFGLTTGVPDLAAHMLFGYGLFQAALLIRLWPWIRQPAFTPGYWSFSFGATALPTMAMRMLERGDTGPMRWVAPILFVGANLFIAILVVSSLRLLLRRGSVGSTSREAGTSMASHSQ